VAAGGYVLQGLLAAANAPGWTSWVSPWHWYLRTNMLVDGPDAVALLLPLILLGVIAAVGIIAFDRRDLR
jgi:ABC-2 type transport system permease protein